MSLFDSWSAQADTQVLSGTQVVRLPLQFNCVPGLAVNKQQLTDGFNGAGSVSSVLDVSENLTDWLNVLHPTAFGWTVTLAPVEGVTAAALRADGYTVLNAINQAAWTSCSNFTVGAVEVLGSNPVAPFANPFVSLTFVSVAVVVVIGFLLFREVTEAL